MKIHGTTKFVVAGVTKQERKDGSGSYYSLSVIDPDTQEAGMMSCDEHVYDVVSGKDFKRYSEHQVNTVYDSSYKWMRIVGIE